MSRTFGFFLGSAVVFALLAFVLGRPVPLAPPSGRDPGPGSGSFTTTTPVRIPAPVSRQDPAPSQQAVTQPAPPQALQAPVNEAVTESSENSGETVAGTDVVVAEAIARPVVVQYQDENALVEGWLAATTTGQPVESTVPAAMAGDETALINGDDMLSPQDTTGAAVSGQATELEWFPVWDPFHSELSANAFARRLERITGLDYRVIKTDATQYRVAMGYTSEEQRLLNVEMIEQATGLSITGGSR